MICFNKALYNLVDQFKGGIEMDYIVDVMKPEDYPAVASIFQEGIDTGVATFETSVPSWEVWDEEHCKPCRLVARSGDKVIGWASIALASSR
jgi:phosphinothricin acetyltransferase